MVEREVRTGRELRELTRIKKVMSGAGRRPACRVDFPVCPPSAVLLRRTGRFTGLSSPVFRTGRLESRPNRQTAKSTLHAGPEAGAPKPVPSPHTPTRPGVRSCCGSQTRGPQLRTLPGATITCQPRNTRKVFPIASRLYRLIFVYFVVASRKFLFETGSK
jgi:hypothetical protein